MKKMLTRVLTFVMCAAVLTGMGTVNAGSEIPKSERAPVVIPVELDRRPLDGNGRIFMFLGAKDSAVHDLYTDGLNGYILNDAIFERNIRAEEMHNIRIDETRTNDVMRMVRNATLAADDCFDAFTLSVSDNLQLASQGMLYDLDRLEKLDLDAQWWNSPINDDTAVRGRQYFAAGDILASDNNAAYMIVYNRTVLADFGIEDDFTQLALDGQWTNEKFDELMLSATYDIDGDGVLSLESGDIIGVASKADCRALLSTSNRLKTVTINPDNKLLKLWKYKTTDGLDELLNHIGDWGLGMQGDDADAVFTGGNSVMYLAAAGELAELRKSAEFEIGILPLPKADTKQSIYTTYTDPTEALTVGVPVMQSDIELCGTVLETMAQLSYKYVTPAYYHTLTNGNDEAAVMLDVIFGGMTVQLDEALFGFSVTEDNADNAAKRIKKLNLAFCSLREIP